MVKEYSKSVRGKPPGAWNVSGLYLAGAITLLVCLIVPSARLAADNHGGGARPDLSYPLPDDFSCHSQGVTVTGGYLFVSCVERKKRLAHINRYRLPAGFPDKAGEFGEAEQFDVTRESMYHPSGLDHDNECLWVAAAHYRSFMARSRISCLDPSSMEEKRGWEVDDHIGAVAAMGETILGMNWDSKDIHRFSRDGEPLGKAPSPGKVAYQDCRGAGDDRALCSGSKKINGKAFGQVDLLVFDAESDPPWRVEDSTLIAHPEGGLGREGFTVISDKWAFLPEDYPGARLFIYSRP